MESNGYRPGRARGESYVTDPGEFPDVKDWRTEIYWPRRSEDTANLVRAGQVDQPE